MVGSGRWNTISTGSLVQTDVESLFSFATAVLSDVESFVEMDVESLPLFDSRLIDDDGET